MATGADMSRSASAFICLHYQSLEKDMNPSLKIPAVPGRVDTVAWDGTLKFQPDTNTTTMHYTMPNNNSHF